MDVLPDGLSTAVGLCVVPGTALLQHRVLRTLRSLTFHAHVRTSHDNNSPVCVGDPNTVLLTNTEVGARCSTLETSAIELKL